MVIETSHVSTMTLDNLINRKILFYVAHSIYDLTICNSIIPGICVRCPHDRTLIAKPGVDRAKLQYPRIQTCSGRKAPRGVRFTRMYGPDFGTLLKEGSHIIVGRITYKGEVSLFL